MNAPTCTAKTRDWPRCGRPATRTHANGWRCSRHSRPTDPAISAEQLVRWRAGEVLREAREDLTTRQARLKWLGEAAAANRAALLGPAHLTQTTDEHGRLKATVFYTDARWETCWLEASVEPGKGDRSPRLGFLDLGRDRGGQYPAAMAALWTWVAEQMRQAQSAYASYLAEAQDQASLDLGLAEHAVHVAQVERDQVNEVLAPRATRERDQAVLS